MAGRLVEEMYLRPLANRIQIDTPIYQSSCQLLSPGFQGVHTECHGPLRLISLNQFQGLCCCEKGQEGINHEPIVPIVGLQVFLQLQQSKDLVNGRLECNLGKIWFDSGRCITYSQPQSSHAVYFV